MKVSQGIHYWLEYHKVHSKKKHHQNLPVDPIQVDRSIRWKGPKLPDPGRGPLFPHRLQPRDQTVNQTNPILPTHFLFQLRYPKSRSQFPKPMRCPPAEKTISSPRTHPLDHSGKGSSGWNHFSHHQTQESANSWIDGPRWNEDRRSLEIDTQWHRGQKAHAQKPQKW